MTPKLTAAAALAAALMMTPTLFADPAAAQPGAAVRPEFAQDSLNVFRRFPVEQRAKMVEFYGTVLGLTPLRPINLGGGQQMILFRVGSGQIKLAAGLKEGRQFHPEGVNDATGIRMFTLQFPDAAALAARFTAAGYPAPVFRDIGGGARAAMVKDPGGFALELIATPNPAPGVDVGVNVSDLARSEAFYRDFAGLEELPPVKDPLLGVTKHPFRHGQTTISLWSVGRNLPHDTGSAGIQYVTRNVDAINARALAEHVSVETPLGGVPGFNIKTVWLNDPDGVTNYFYQLGAPGGRAPAAAPPRP